MGRAIKAFRSALLILASALSYSCLESSPGTDAPETGTPQGLFGVLVDASGKPVAGAAVHAVLVPVSAGSQVPAKRTAADDTATTDSTGTFVFENLASGTYNLQGDYDRGSLVVLIREVQYAGNGSVKELPTDTLRAAGRIEGRIITSVSGDGGTLCSIPGTSCLATTDDSGRFLIANVPQGAFPLECRKDGFLKVSETSVQVQSGKATVLGSKSMEPDPAFPPPPPENLRAWYDTVSGAVRLAWSPVGVSDLDGYWVYRNASSAADPQRINPDLIRDTTYVDSAHRVSDSADLNLIYRVKAQDENADISTVHSQPVTVATLAPLRTNLVFPDFILAGDTIAVQGFARSGVALTSLDVSIWRGNTEVSTGGGFTISSSPLPGGRKQWDYAADARLEIITAGDVAGGEYVLRVVARAGGRVSADSSVFEVGDGMVSERSLVAGAQSNATSGAFIDLDDFRAHTLAPAMAIAADIDLVFAYSTSIISAAIYSPYAAKNGVWTTAGFDFVQGLEPANRTEMRLTNADFASIRTQSQIDSLWSSGADVADGRLPLDSGTVFLAKSDKGLIVLIQAEDVFESATGKAGFRGKAKF